MAANSSSEYKAVTTTFLRVTKTLIAKATVVSETIRYLMVKLRHLMKCTKFKSCDHFTVNA